MMMAEDPGPGADRSGGRDQVAAIRAESGGQFVQAVTGMRRSGVRYVVRDDDRRPVMEFRQLAGEPGSRQALLMKRVGRKKRPRAGGTTYMLGIIANRWIGGR